MLQNSTPMRLTLSSVFQGGFFLRKSHLAVTAPYKATGEHRPPCWPQHRLLLKQVPLLWAVRGEGRVAGMASRFGKASA